MKWRTIREMPTLEKAFEALRNSKAHVGMGSIQMSLEEQKALCEVAKKQFFNSSSRCEQLVAFCLWLQKEKGGRIEEGKEEEVVWEWTET
jgi:hypothetical protein